ncbi:putative dehydrogenase [Dyadobacter sp. BE34]|uniref:Dehydrogenase n=1 Tax=Dyadobacter fermentans TaxID=94254 RepID=A0ABU1QVZ3_9BACT|nr:MULTISPECIES: Gfo/Idh/MocA family oxidoreductase [Dyadobacter]MDR6805157.1 putative dehydrogenase [Dyadobacter fermentans]MDR7043084.1 putative dehydrogenase [Dyadobacter sp. BE242]MDR7197396.1 putative dehydrogenase [Dyadobacter sp. BE34]MDR7215171.1 putative dehydrogenase [Dyadobacter sp. BE31]MDR7262706.1 putative dehydrogenase [Dyadobacter sp. BE32]
MTISRRKFIHTAAAVAGGTAISPIITDLAHAGRPIRSAGASTADRIRVAAIGINSMGWADVNAVMKNPGVECVALCDVDRNVLDKRAAELAGRGMQVKTFNDYRRILDSKDIDAVVIGTPDHWHCLMMAEACDAGKDVYVEKPIGNSIAECRAMVAAQQRTNRVVQVGQWQRSQKHFRDAVDFVHSGKLGKVGLVKVWGYFNYGNPILKQPDGSAPAGVDYGMWLGPAMKRPFNPNRFHGSFRWFWDYAGGIMTDWGVHLLDYALLGMKANATPKRVSASGAMLRNPGAETPDTLTALFEYDDFNIQWEHVIGYGAGIYNRQHGIAFLGENGTLIVDREGWEAVPYEKRMEGVPLTKSSDNGLDEHAKNFVEVIRSRRMDDLHAPIQAGAEVATLSQMGNIAYRTGNTLHWNAQKGEFDDPMANKLMTSEYHNGYKMPRV